MPTREDFTDQTIQDPSAEYIRCRFRRTTMSGQIDIVLTDCLVDSLTISEPLISRFETRGTTDAASIVVTKGRVQASHWRLSIRYLKHRHQFIAATFVRYARTIRRSDPRLAEQVYQAARVIDRLRRISWDEFLSEVPKDVWDIAHLLFADYPEIRDHAIAIREKRWPV